MALPCDHDFEIMLNFYKFTYMVFGLIEIDSKIIKFEQIGPDNCHFIDLSLAIGGQICQYKISTG